MFSPDGNDDGVDAYDEDDDVACNIAISVALAWVALQTFIGLPGVGHTATTTRERINMEVIEPWEMEICICPEGTPPLST